MEDQQPDPGALIESDEDGLQDSAAADAEAPEIDIEPEIDSAEADSESDEAGSEDGSTASEGDGTPEPKRRSGRLLTGVVAVAAALFVGAAAFAGATVEPYLADRAVVATKMQIVKTAIAAITTLWNYTPENMDGLADRASGYLSGDLKAQYRKLIDTIVESNKQAKVTNNTEITGAAVESLSGSEATVLVYMNTTATSDAQKGLPSLKYLTYRLFMKRDNNRWVVTKMPTVTSLSLTPQF